MKAARNTLAALAALSLWGCAVGQAPNGKMVVGFGVADGGQIETPAEQIGAFASLFGVPAPAAAAGVGGILGLIQLIRKSNQAAELQGAERGWDQAVLAARPQPTGAPHA